MMLGWIAVTIAAALAGYFVGRNVGVSDANASAVRPGAWVEVVAPLPCRKDSSSLDYRLPVGTQAVVTGRDNWGRLSLWVADPWARSYGWTVPQVFDVKAIHQLRARPIMSIAPDVREPTLAALAKWEEQNAELQARLFPPGFIDLQRLLNQ